VTAVRAAAAAALTATLGLAAACCVGSRAGLMAMLVVLGVMSAGWMAAIAVLVTVQKLIHRLGAESGAERVTPVACSPRGGGRFAIWAANGGSPANPNWYYNLKAHPKITVEVGTQTFTVLAQELDDTARAELWPKLVAEWPKPVAGSPDLGAAQATTTRQFPVFMLTRQD
jgi:deazaflavin-dependent oxidoreductase (nitroreductase family)